ncbi:hypothetical protein BH23ACT10_BH23ACT10_10440 [soil metagenome]
MAVALRDLERVNGPRRPALRIVHPQPPLPPPTPTPAYWLRRLLVLAVVAAVILGAVVVTRAATSARAPAPARVEMAVVVPAGETLWDVARRYAPAGADRSAWVVDVADRNAVDPATIQPGTPLVVPVEGQHVLADPQVPSVR